MLEIFSNPFYTFCMGLGLGAVFLVMAVINHWKTKGEFRRYKTHLSDKLELEARQMQETNKEKTRLSGENESLRVQIARLNERPDNKLSRELEILARAEKHMMINAPGFAPAWELAKASAMSQLESEEKGSSFPQKIFRKLIGSGSGSNGTGPTSLPEASVSSGKSSSTSTAAA
ncbi:hypothetical protein [Brevifollis gellanilyticus]|uniref:Uncharacterized protein n=1 Tax=Brevifollis gellanilyticus TaxID=748831 RepID=A0A512M9T9_9BACT|nr:hypothetical protein [Brevifollis gellanilyticus]GEP43508.1 hypothetical protein BGE01nite_27990 [Brevifollis gellanilyticus]